MSGKQISKDVQEFNLKGTARERRKQFRAISKQHPECEITKHVPKIFKKKRVKTCVHIQMKSKI
jgi:hypothetical protein